MIETRIDARGMRCPWPVIRLARAIREGADRVMIQADDPIAPGEIAALAESRGWALAADDKVASCWHVATDPAFLR